MSNTTILEQRAKEIRYHLTDAIASLGVGHLGGCLSIADILAVLYFDKMNIDPTNPKMQGRDRLVTSKGHAGPAVYAALALKGYFPLEWLKTLNAPDTLLPSHCDMNRTPGIDMTAGSLGQGISCAVGIAMGSKLAKDNATIYCIIGDGESQEGQVWEAAMAAAQYKLDNLIVFLDNNGMQIDGLTKDINDLLDPVAKWSAFGFECFSVNGHCVDELSNAVDSAKGSKNSKPKMIVAATTKGRGVSFVEAAGYGSHNMPVTAEQHKTALCELS